MVSIKQWFIYKDYKIPAWKLIVKCCLYLPKLFVGCVTQGQFLSGVLLVWIQSLHSRLVSLLKLKIPVYSTGGRRDGFMPFFEALMQSKMHRVSSRIWTQFTKFIFYVNCYIVHSSATAKCSFCQILIVKTD